MARIDLGMVKGTDGKTLTINGITPDANGNVLVSAGDVGAAAAIHAARHAKGGADAITPASIGALPSAGGVLSGPLLLKTASKGYTQLLKNHSETDDYGSYIEDVGADGGVTRLTLRSAAASQDAALRLEHKGASYKIYGEHNKPTAADIGALPRMELSSYVGTGVNSTESSPMTLSFSFAPDVVMLLGHDFRQIGNGTDYSSFEFSNCNNNGGDHAATQIMQLWSTEYTQGRFFGNGYGASSKRYGKKSADGKTLYWYDLDPNGSATNLNFAGYTYYYLGIKFGG